MFVCLFCFVFCVPVILSFKCLYFVILIIVSIPSLESLGTRLFLYLALYATFSSLFSWNNINENQSKISGYIDRGVYPSVPLAD